MYFALKNTIDFFLSKMRALRKNSAACKETKVNKRRLQDKTNKFENERERKAAERGGGGKKNELTCRPEGKNVNIHE